jgi:hypothetical protein
MVSFFVMIRSHFLTPKVAASSSSACFVNAKTMGLRDVRMHCCCMAMVNHAHKSPNFSISAMTRSAVAARPMAGMAGKSWRLMAGKAAGLGWESVRKVPWLPG